MSKPHSPPPCYKLHCKLYKYLFAHCSIPISIVCIVYEHCINFVVIIAIFFFSARSGGFFFWRCLEQALALVIMGILLWNMCQCFLGCIVHCITCLTRGLRLHISSKGNSTQEQPRMIHQAILHHVSWIYLLTIGPYCYSIEIPVCFVQNVFNGNHAKYINA